MSFLKNIFGRDKADPGDSPFSSRSNEHQNVGVLVSVGFVTTPEEFQILLNNGDLVPGLQYVTIESSKDEAENKEFLETMYQGACTKQGWTKGVHSDLTIKRTHIGEKEFIIIYQSSE